jgi:hypothetical protein
MAKSSEQRGETETTRARWTASSLLPRRPARKPAGSLLSAAASALSEEELADDVLLPKGNRDPSFIDVKVMMVLARCSKRRAS